MSNLFGLEGVVAQAGTAMNIADDITGEVALEGFFEASAALEGCMASQDKYNFGLENLTRLVNIACTEQVDTAFCKLAGAELGAALRLGSEAITPNMTDAQKDRLQAACEGVIADWWEKIKAFFKMLWEKIKSFFKWLFSSAYRRNQAIVKLKEKFKNTGKLDETAFADKLINTYSVDGFKQLFELVNEIIAFNVPNKMHVLIAKLETIATGTEAPDYTAKINSIKTEVPVLDDKMAERLSLIGLRMNESDDGIIAAKSDMIIKEERTVAKHGWTTTLVAEYLNKLQDLNDSSKSLKAFDAKNQEAIKLATEAISKVEQFAKKATEDTAKKSQIEKAARSAATELQKRQMVYTRLANEGGKLIVNLTSVIISLGNAVPVKK